MQEKLKQIFLLVLGLLLFAIPAGSYLYQKYQYQKALKTFTSIEVKYVRAFHIYARTSIPRGIPITFKISDPIIEDFFSSLSDIRSYWPTHDTIISTDHQWLVEIFLKDKMMTLYWYIPSKKGEIVVGEFGIYGAFQSKLLYRWYQKYKDRWLNPGKPQLPEHTGNDGGDRP